MPVAIKFSGYVLSAMDSKRICVRLDVEHVDRITSILSQMYDRTSVKDTVTINVSNSRYNISHDWSELSDLVGLHIDITAHLRKFSYWKAKELIDDYNDSHTTITQYKGVSINAVKVSNITS